jgi:hypothetical protein
MTIGGSVLFCEAQAVAPSAEARNCDRLGACPDGYSRVVLANVTSGHACLLGVYWSRVVELRRADPAELVHKGEETTLGRVLVLR